MMNPRMNHFWTDMHAEDREGEDTEAVARNCKRYDKGGEQSPLPIRTQEQMASQQTGQKQYQARPNSTAFFSHLDGYPGQLKDQALAKKGGFSNREKHVCG